MKHVIANRSVRLMSMWHESRSEWLVECWCLAILHSGHEVLKRLMRASQCLLSFYFHNLLLLLVPVENRTAAEASLDKFLFSLLSLNDGSDVNITQESPVLGSAQATVPNEPLWPKLSMDGPLPNLKSRFLCAPAAGCPSRPLVRRFIQNPSPYYDPEPTE